MRDDTYVTKKTSEKGLGSKRDEAIHETDIHFLIGTFVPQSNLAKPALLSYTHACTLNTHSYDSVHEPK